MMADALTIQYHQWSAATQYLLCRIYKSFSSTRWEDFDELCYLNIDKWLQWKKPHNFTFLWKTSAYQRFNVSQVVYKNFILNLHYNQWTMSHNFISMYFRISCTHPSCDLISLPDPPSWIQLIVCWFCLWSTLKEHGVSQSDIFREIKFTLLKNSYLFLLCRIMQYNVLDIFWHAGNRISNANCLTLCLQWPRY